MADGVDITVAVCTWNRAALLDQTLAGLTRLRVPAGLRWELVVVDNNSPDHTPDVLARHARDGRLPLRAVRETAQGHTHARNRALAEARGPLVLWTDDDVRTDPDWLAAFAAAAARHPAAAGFGGPVTPWFPTPPDPDLAAAFRPLAIGYCGIDHGPPERPLGPAEKVFGANMGFNMAVVRGLRFDPRLGRRPTTQAGGDDIDYVDRARAFGPVVWVPDMRLEHYVIPERLTPGYVKRYLKDNLLTTTAPPDPNPRLFGVPRWMYRRHLWLAAEALAAGVRGRRAERYRLLVARWKLEAQMTLQRRAVGWGAGG